MIRAYQKHPSSPKKDYYENCLCGEKLIRHYDETCDHMFCHCYYRKRDIDCLKCASIIPFLEKENVERLNIISKMVESHPVTIFNNIIDNESLQRINIITEYEKTKHAMIILSIYTTAYVPINDAIVKYKSQRNIGNSDKWIQDHLKRFSNLLQVQKIKNRWVCSKQRLEIIEFDLAERIGFVDRLIVWP